MERPTETNRKGLNAMSADTVGGVMTEATNEEAVRAMDEHCHAGPGVDWGRGPVCEATWQCTVIEEVTERRANLQSRWDQ